jgi:hypothetical protein
VDALFSNEIQYCTFLLIGRQVPGFAENYFESGKVATCHLSKFDANPINVLTNRKRVIALAVLKNLVLMKKIFYY